MSGKPSPTATVNYHFVTGNPQSETEKRNVRTIVRSNASNRRWMLVRETAARGKKKTDDDQSKEWQESASDASKSSSKATTEIRRKPRKQRVNGKHAMRQQSVARTSTDGMVESAHELTRQQWTASIERTTGPAEIVNLSQNFFGSMPMSEVSKQSIRKMLQGTAASYAQLFPSGKGASVSRMSRDWFQQCMRTSGILHTALFCQAMRAQAVRPGWRAIPANELVICQTEAVRAIAHKLTQAETACDDESIRIVFSLAWHGSIKQDPPAKSPKQSPLADLQSLRLFMGTIACDPIHYQGLMNMLNVRGGLEKVDMPGLAFLVSYGDILTASCNLSRPIYSYGSYAQHASEARIDDEWLYSIQRVDHVLNTLGGGFSILHACLPPDRASKLQSIGSILADLTRASHNFLTGPPEERNKAVMADQRNMAQHTLMTASLLPIDIFVKRDLYELCWYAMVAYSFMAVFPLAPAAARFDRLAQFIQTALSNHLQVANWHDTPQLMLWSAVMGALCATGTFHREWYIRLLQRERHSLGICSWQILKLKLMDFLWFPCVSDTDGEDLWAEIDQLDRISVFNPSADG